MGPILGASSLFRGGGRPRRPIRSGYMANQQRPYPLLPMELSSGSDVAWLRARLARIVARVLPTGRALPAIVWARRHRGVTGILWLHVAGVFVFGLSVGAGVPHSLLEAVLVAIPAGLASVGLLGQAGRSVAASLGLVAASATLVHLAGGAIEMHFHFFVMVGVISLYQSWLPFLAAIGFVMLHHAVLGSLVPGVVFENAADRSSPLVLAAIHGGFILAASAVSLTNWRLVEHERLHDALTGLPNRTGFADRVWAAVGLDRGEAAGRRPVTVLFIDIDAFRQVNDQYGPAVGDHVLAIVGVRIRDAVERGVAVARYGGDEFTVLLPSTDRASIERTANRLRETIETGILVGDRELRVTVRIGIATADLDEFPADGADTIVRNAETAMLMAKQRGLRHEYYEPAMRTSLIERLSLRQDLEIAVDGGAIQIAFQPIVDLATGRPIAAEALARWTHPVRGPVPPLEFIPVAEETDLILRLGRRIIADSCLRLGEWQRAGLVGRDFMVSVNLSARQLEDPSLVPFVKSAIAEAGIDSPSLILELTESAIVQDTATVIEQIEALRAIGVRLAIDDFGTGYSSLSYLRQLPIQILKIDMSFVADLDLVLDNRSLIETILSLGESLGLRTVAEGIERASQVDVLRSLGCVYGQGYLYSRPIDGEAFVAWLGARNAATPIALGSPVAPRLVPLEPSPLDRPDGDVAAA